MSGALAVAKRMPNGSSDTHLFLQTIARQIASTNESGYSYCIPESVFGQTRSNLDEDEIKGLFADFAIKDPWNQMSVLSSRIGLKPIHSLRDDFINFTMLRHQCAHDATTNVQPSDLQAMARTALAVSIAFDILLSAAILMPLPAPKDGKHEKREIEEDVALRFLVNSSRGWRDIKEGGRKATRVYPALAQALKANHANFIAADAQPRAVIVKDTINGIEGWIPCVFSVTERI